MMNLKVTENISILRAINMKENFYNQKRMAWENSKWLMGTIMLGTSSLMSFTIMVSLYYLMVRFIVDLLRMAKNTVLGIHNFNNYKGVLDILRTLQRGISK